MRPPSVVKVLTLPDLSDELVIGLKVYTHRDCQAIVRGQLRYGILSRITMCCKLLTNG